VSTGHAPAARLEAGSHDGLDGPARRYFAHAIRARQECHGPRYAPFFAADVVELAPAGGTA
jgi:hypothetical protein